MTSEQDLYFLQWVQTRLDRLLKRPWFRHGLYLLYILALLLFIAFQTMRSSDPFPLAAVTHVLVTLSIPSYMIVLTAVFGRRISRDRERPEILRVEYDAGLDHPSQEINHYYLANCCGNVKSLLFYTPYLPKLIGAASIYFVGVEADTYNNGTSEMAICTTLSYLSVVLIPWSSLVHRQCEFAISPPAASAASDKDGR